MLILFALLVGSCGFMRLPPSNNVKYVFTDSVKYNKIVNNLTAEKEHNMLPGWCTRIEAIRYLEKNGFKKKQSANPGAIYYFKLTKSKKDKINVWVYEDYWKRHDDADSGLEGFEEKMRKAREDKEKSQK